MAANSRFFLVACVVSGLPVQCYPQERHNHDRYRQRSSYFRQLRPRALPLDHTSQDEWFPGRSNSGQQPDKIPLTSDDTQQEWHKLDKIKPYGGTPARPTGSTFKDILRLKKRKKHPVPNSSNELELTTMTTPRDTPIPVYDDSQDTGVHSDGHFLGFRNWSVWIFFLIILAIGISPIIAALVIMKMTRASCYKTLMSKLRGEPDVSIELHAAAQVKTSPNPQLHPQLYPGQYLSERCYLMKDIECDTHGSCINPEKHMDTGSPELQMTCNTRVVAGQGTHERDTSESQYVQIPTGSTADLTFKFHKSGQLKEIVERDTAHHQSDIA